MDWGKLSLIAHKKARGKIVIKSKLPVFTPEDLSIAYTPGVAEVSTAISEERVDVSEVVASKNMVAVVTDGSAVLGLGNIGSEAALPVMEGKAVLFREMAGVEAFPIALKTQDVDEIVRTVELISPTFGGINLEDISAPRCFEIEERLKKSLDIPVFHDDQHGTAIVALAGLINALKIVGKKKDEIKIVIAGAGAAGVAIAKLLNRYGFSKLLIIDSQGVISKNRDDLDEHKQALLEISNRDNFFGSLKEALAGADVFIGVSRGSLLEKTDIENMNEGAIVLAMANPTPEIMPDDARAGGAMVVATGRSDFPNQMNNVLAFPGIFKGALEAGVVDITDDMKMAAAEALAELVEKPTADKIIPTPFDPGVAEAVADAVRNLS